MRLFQTVKFIFDHPLTRTQRFSAYKRWLRWQFGSRISLGASVIEFAGGTRLLAQPGMTGATGNIYCGLHECHDMGFVLHFLRTGDFFLDVGANIGSYTVLASGAVGAETVCFEPVPKTFQHLLDNIHLNRLTECVTAHNVAVGSEAGVLEMIADQDTVNRVIADEVYSGATVSVPVVTLDEILAGRVPKLIKVDVEGFETLVLQGAMHTLKNPQLEAVLMELNGSGKAYGFDEQAIHKNMIDMGFNQCSYNVLTRKLHIGTDMNWYTGNNLYVRNPKSAQDLLSSAKRYPVIGMQL
ncbi:MAG: FkbM family methyltransferase [Gammaproteobacteria bacterium]